VVVVKLDSLTSFEIAQEVDGHKVSSSLSADGTSVDSWELQSAQDALESYAQGVLAALLAAAQ
jgi:hypothetical protein